MSPRSHPDPVTPALSRWLDGRSRPGEADAIEARLSTDAAFSAEVARLRAAADAMRVDAHACPPDDLADRVLAEVARRGGETARFERFARRYAVAAAALLGIGIAGVAMNPSKPMPAPRGYDALAALEDDRLATEARTEVELFAPGDGRSDGR